MISNLKHPAQKKLIFRHNIFVRFEYGDTERLYTHSLEKVKINNPKDVQQHVFKMILGKSTGTERRNKHDWWHTTMTATNMRKGLFN